MILYITFISMTVLGTSCSQANITRDSQTGIQVWLGIGIQLISGLTETLLVRTVNKHAYKMMYMTDSLHDEVKIIPFLPSIFLCAGSESNES